MLRSLAGSSQSIGQLAEPFDMSFPAASKHLRVLESAGLVSRSIEGRTHRFQIRPALLNDAHRWLRFYENLWNEQLDALAAMLDGENEKASAANTETRIKPGSRRRKTAHDQDSNR